MKKETAKKVKVKEGVSNDEFLQSKPQTFTNAKCSKCDGSGLLHPTFRGSEFCAQCKGTGLEPLS